MSISLLELKNIQREFDEKHHISGKGFFQKINEENIFELEHLIVCLVGEIGEFSNIVKKISRGDESMSDRFSEISEELADIFIYMIKISNQLDIDIESEILMKIKKNGGRFPHIEEGHEKK
jgi:NTP pyrophosphatase (non-canonical NTP hydrolase)